MTPSTFLTLIEKAREYLTKNPERLNEKEKKEFMSHLLANLKGDAKFYYDDVFDFLLKYGFISGISRHESFAKYITQRFKPTNYTKVLDVGAGRLCHLSQILSNHGFNMFAMDPNIRLLQHEAKSMNIHILKNLFICDDFKKGKSPTDITSFDLIVGREPCLATEHIIRQSLKYDKPFEVVLCYEAHDALNGKHFRTVDEWFEHLLKISREIEIIKYNGDFIARRIDTKKNLELTTSMENKIYKAPPTYLSNNQEELEI